MKTYLLFILLLFPVVSQASDFEDRLRDVSVTVLVPGSVGSGVIYRDKQRKVYCVTAGHVCYKAYNFTTKKWGQATIARPLYTNGIKNGKFVQTRANVIKYSNIDTGHDIAILELVDDTDFPDGITLPKHPYLSQVGESLVTIGSPRGWVNSHTITGGKIKNLNVLVSDNLEYHLADFGTDFGNSGGGVFNKHGEYVGMFTRGSAGPNAYFIPLWRLRHWLKSQEFNFDN